MIQPEAFLLHEGSAVVPLIPPAPFPLWTPVTALIEGVWNQFPDQALSILRNRIYSAIPLTPLSEGMVRVAAKRATVLPAPEFKELWEKTFFNKELIEVTPRIPTLLDAVVSKPGVTPSWEEICNHASSLFNGPDLPISAVLYDSEFKIVDSAINLNSLHKTLHAELNLIQKFCTREKKKIPAHLHLLVTLQPCAMCAAQIFTFFEDLQKSKITFLKEDPGPFAQNSVFMKNSDLWKRAGSPNCFFTMPPQMLRKQTQSK